MGDDRSYYEILQEYAHLADIHWVLSSALTHSQP